jgi:MtN3 and saliva related transmembrane protein
MYVLFVLGVGLWLLYGMLNNQMPIIAGNLITFILAGTILLFMVKGLLSRK